MLERQNHRLLAIKDLDFMSAMSLSYPVTWSITSGLTWQMHWWRARDLTNRAATLDFGVIIVSHEHAGVLSLCTRVVSWVIVAIFSCTSHCNRTAAISRSELVTFLWGYNCLQHPWLSFLDIVIARLYWYRLPLRSSIIFLKLIQMRPCTLHKLIFIW